MANPALTGNFDGVDVGDLVRFRDRMLGMVVGTPGFFHVCMVFADGSCHVGARRYLRRHDASRHELYYGPVRELRAMAGAWWVFSFLSRLLREPSG